MPAAVLNRAKNRRVAVIAGAGVAAMVGLAYASVPLYALFCQATGFGGTTQRAAAAPDHTIARSFTIRFDANIAASLNWKFQPVQTTMRVKAGEQAMAAYRATNLGAATSTGTAVFNVTPPGAGIYFNKIQCFCFTEQKLAAHQSEELPVMFFVDPDIAQDPDLATLDEIVLSYTFYPAGAPAPAAQIN